MDKNEIRNEQPVIWQTLSNALKEDRLSHVYLFTGAHEAAKKEMALLLVQSLFCRNLDEDGYACQDCDICRSIEHDHHPDFVRAAPGMIRTENLTKKDIHRYFEGKLDPVRKGAEAILKTDIVTLQETLGASPQNGTWQAYIIEDFDRATREASNAFLKFLEEPKDNMLGILISDRADLLLPTVRSRVQQISFRPVSREKQQKFLEAAGIPEGDFLIQFGYSAREAEKWFTPKTPPEEGRKKGAGKKEKEKEDLRSVGEILIEEADRLVRNGFSMPDLLHLQTGIFSPESEYMDKKYVRFFLQRVWYETGRKYSGGKKALLQQAVLEVLDDLYRPLDLGLLLDALCIRLFRIDQSR